MGLHNLNKSEFILEELLETLLSQNVNAKKYASYSAACNILVLSLLWNPNQIELLVPQYFTPSDERSQFLPYLTDPKQRENLIQTISIICQKYCDVLKTFDNLSVLSIICRAKIDSLKKEHLLSHDVVEGDNQVSYELANLFISKNIISNRSLFVNKKIAQLSSERYQLFILFLNQIKLKLVIKDLTKEKYYILC